MQNVHSLFNCSSNSQWLNLSPRAVNHIFTAQKKRNSISLEISKIGREETNCSQGIKNLSLNKDFFKTGTFKL